MEYRRPQFETLSKRLQEPRRWIQVVIGPRQVGKTTLVHQVLREYSAPYEFHSGDAVGSEQDSAFWLRNVWRNARLSMDAKRSDRYLLVIDEIHKIKNWSEAVKAEWDRDSRENRNLCVVLLGSSRMLLQKGLTESLTGRYELIRLSHWTYAEMRTAFGFSLNQFIYFGGYPGPASLIVSDLDEVRWRFYVKNALIAPTINNDVLMNTGIAKPELLRRLFSLGCAYSGELLSLTKIQGQLQDAGNVTTLAGYLTLLSQNELLTGLQKYAGDAARKYASIPKFMVHNTALANVQKEHSFLESQSDASLWGRCVENAVGAYLLTMSDQRDFKVMYWRERSAEVDFVLQRGGKIIALEVKSGKKTSYSGLAQFEKNFCPLHSIVVGTGGISLENFLLTDPVNWFEI